MYVSSNWQAKSQLHTTKHLELQLCRPYYCSSSILTRNCPCRNTGFLRTPRAFEALAIFP